MKITKEEVLHVANLARLSLKEEELERLTEQLDDILNYVAKLDELDTSSVSPTTHVLSICNAFREDKVEASLPLEKALKNCANHNMEFFKVPKIL